jgi:hypothetical protein
MNFFNKKHEKIDYIFQIILSVNAFLVCTAIIYFVGPQLVKLGPWPLIFLYWLITGIRNVVNLIMRKSRDVE